MPTYNYECSGCGHNLEIVQNMKDEPLKECPKCKGMLEKIIIGIGGIVFNGNGFHSTDYDKYGRK